ncbi:MAG TPA: hypothetical protein DEO56_07860 [Nitrosomonas nitrosa]|nr:hypothetical protein [Nitrosomonas nitrosa]HNP52413.1 hypothetical protein [Nitrosomonas nitrosa]
MKQNQTSTASGKTKYVGVHKFTPTYGLRAKILGHLGLPTRAPPRYEAIIHEGGNERAFKVTSIHGTAYHILAMTIRLNQAIAEFMLSDRRDQKREQLIEKIKAYKPIVDLTLNCSGN